MKKLSFVTPLMHVSGTRLRNWRVVHHHLRPLLDNQAIEWIVPESGSRAGELEGTRRIAVNGRPGRSAMRNIGWRSATGDMICFLDADVVMKPKAWLKALNRCWDFDVYSPYVNGVKLTRPQSRIVCDKIRAGKWNFGISATPKRWNLCGGICCIRRQALEDVDGWDERFTGWGYEDGALADTLTKGGYSCKMDGDQIALHLWHPITGTKRQQGNRSRRLFLREYDGRSFIDILQRRRTA